MTKKTQTIPSLNRQLGMAVLASAVCCLFLFLFSWHSGLPPLAIRDYAMAAHLVLSGPVLINLLLSIYIYLLFKRLPLCRAAARPAPMAQAKILKILRADAYSYLLLPSLVVLTMAWIQIGGYWLLVALLTATVVIVKSFFIFEIKQLYKI